MAAAYAAGGGGYSDAPVLKPMGQHCQPHGILLENDIPITKENILYKVQLDSLNISDLQSGDGLKQLIGSIVNGMAQGENASDTLLINSTGTYQTVADAISTVYNADIRHVAYVTENDETFNIENLRNAMNSVDAASYRFSLRLEAKKAPWILCRRMYRIIKMSRFMTATSSYSRFVF